MSYARGNKKSATPSFEDLVNQDLKKKSYRPIYILAGEDTLRVEGVVNKMRQDALGEANAAFNFHVFQGDQTPIARVLQQANSLPMLGGLQMIWVKQGDKCLSDTDSQALFEKYAGRPTQETLLVLSMNKVDKRKKWVKTCTSAGYVFDFSPPTGDALVQWVMKAARKENLNLGQEEARILCELVGNDLLALKSEIDKLALLSEVQGKPIEPQELSRIIMDQAALEGFEITANLEPGKASEVLKTWFRLAEWGKSPYEISPLVLSRIRKAALLSACRESGLADNEIGALTGTNPWSFRYFQTLLNALGPKGVQRALKVSLDCDQKMKSSPLKPDIILEKTLLKLCSKETG